MKRTLMALLAGLLILSGCGGGSSSDDMPSGYDTNTFVDYIYSGQEYQTLNYLTSWSAVDFYVTANCVDGLLEYDKYGIIQPSLAESYEHNDDYSVWTFKLREGVKWLNSSREEVAEVTADDFVYAAEYILDPINASFNVNSFLGVIEGADEYYAAMENGETPDFDTVGVKALDKYTVQYTMDNGKGTPYFDSAVTYAAYEPANREYVEGLPKGDTGAAQFGIDKDHILYNGAYILDNVVLENEKTFTKNEEYWDAEHVTVDTIKVLHYRDQESIYEGFMRGDVYRCPILTTTAQRLYDEGNPYLIQTDLGAGVRYMTFNNRTKYSEDVNKALSNLNFRKSLFHGFDRAAYNETTNPINPESIEAFGFSGSDFVYNDEGVDYTMIGALKDWHTSQYDVDKALEYKEKAMAELESEGVTFPVDLIYQYQSGNETTANQAALVKQIIEDNLGTDYITVTLKEYASGGWADVRFDGDYAIAFGGWSPDWGDPVNNLTCMMTNAGTANEYEDYENAGNCHWNYPEYDQLVQEADKITDKDARYEAFAKAEAYLIENAYFVPLAQGGGTYTMQNYNTYSRIHTGVGIDQFKYKGIEVYDHVITAEENAQLKSEWEAAREEAMKNAQS